MGKVDDSARKILIWSYERGSLQYDIICALILAFIFFVPPSCFVKKEVPQKASRETVPEASPGETKP
ncbi:MAG: hypothetical protein DMG10_01890 [Acidobacteria bacterium]|nr:MAG: hypothetical protein DMG10_01890 [Acidobacteriota bacterium]